MSFSVIPSVKFKKEVKRLSKKYPSLKEELAELNETLENEPETGTAWAITLRTMKILKTSGSPRFS
jgi:hypothetical protein